MMNQNWLTMNLEEVEQEFNSWFSSDKYRQIVKEAARVIESNSNDSGQDNGEDAIVLFIHIKLCMAEVVLGNVTEAIDVAKNGYYLSYGLAQKASSGKGQSIATKLLATQRMIQFKRILAECYGLDSDFENAEKLISEAMSETENNFNNSNEEQFENSDAFYFLLQVSNYITNSEIHRCLVRFDQGEEFSRRALNFSKRLSTKFKSMTISARFSLIESLRCQMKFTEALELAKFNLEESEKHFAKTSLQYMKAKMSLGAIYLFLGKYQKAEECLLDVQAFAIEFDKKQFFADMGDLKYYIAVLNWKQNKKDNALVLFSEALEFYKRLYKRDHPAMIDCLSDFAILLMELKKDKEAKEYQSRKDSILTIHQI